MTFHLADAKILLGALAQLDRIESNQLTLLSEMATFKDTIIAAFNFAKARIAELELENAVLASDDAADAADLAAAKAKNELIKEMMANGGAKTSSDAKRYIARMQEIDRKAEEIKARGPHNAYGTKEARDKVLRKVQNDIEARDRADEDAVKRKPVGVDFIYGEPATYRKMSKMEKMAYDDQAKRSGYNEEGSFGRRHIVSGVKGTEVFPDARKRGIKPADPFAKGGSVSKRGDGCACLLYTSDAADE